MMNLYCLKIFLFVGIVVIFVLLLVYVKEKFKVIIMFIVIVDMVKNVVGDVVEVSLIIKFGVEIYEYQLMFGDIK